MTTHPLFGEYKPVDMAEVHAAVRRLREARIFVGAYEQEPMNRWRPDMLFAVGGLKKVGVLEILRMDEEMRANREVRKHG